MAGTIQQPRVRAVWPLARQNSTRGVGYLLGSRPLAAALEVEAQMMESHAKRLSAIAPQLADPETQREILKLSQEEAERAEGIRRQIRMLRDHL